MLTENSNVCIVHIIVISVLITVNYCNAFCYLVHELIPLCILDIEL